MENIRRAIGVARLLEVLGAPLLLLKNSGGPLAKPNDFLRLATHLSEIGAFFEASRKALPNSEIMLGCARPLGAMKVGIDRLAVDAGLNGIAYPADGVVAYAESRGLQPEFINACCGVSY